MTDHSPAPWRIDGAYKDSVRCVQVLSATNVAICEAVGWKAEANANLIVEAPTLKAENEELKTLNEELLTALKAVVAESDIDTVSYRYAHSVIAKVERR